MSLPELYTAVCTGGAMRACTDLCRKGDLLKCLLEIFMLYLRVTREGLN